MTRTLDLRYDVDFGKPCPKKRYHTSQVLYGGLAQSIPRTLLHCESGGYAALVKVVTENELERLDLDDPDALFDLAYLFSSSPASREKAANALRKMRATVRTGRNTLDMGRAEFERVVTNGEDGALTWGEFPYGGAVIVRRNGVCYIVGVSGFLPEEDDYVAKQLAEFLALDAELSATT